jgi:hypothetical protein
MKAETKRPNLFESEICMTLNEMILAEKKKTSIYGNALLIQGFKPMKYRSPAMIAESTVTIISFFKYPEGKDAMRISV